MNAEEKSNIETKIRNRREFLGLAAVAGTLVLATSKSAEAACNSSFPPSTDSVNVAAFWLSTDPTFTVAGVVYRDYSNAFQRAIDNLTDCAGGGSIYVPPSAHAITRPVMLKNNIRIFGKGPSSNVSFYGSGSFTMQMVADVEFANLGLSSLNGSASNGSVAIIANNTTWGPKRIRIAHCSFFDCGLKLDAGSDANENWFKEILITDNILEGRGARILLSGLIKKAIVSGNIVSGQADASANLSGIQCEGLASQIVISNNIAFGCTQNGIQVVGGGNIVISDNICYKNLQSGIGLNTDALDKAPHHVILANNICMENGYDGMDLVDQAGLVPMRLAINGNILKNNRTTGIYLKNVKGAVLTGNICETNYSSGILITSSKFISLNANFLWGNGYSSLAFPSSTHEDSEKNGIYFADSSDCCVTGNISSNDGLGPSQEYGIRCNNCTRISLVGNNVYNNKLGGIYTDSGNYSLTANQPGDQYPIRDRGFFGAQVFQGFDSPEGQFEAPMGSLFVRVNGLPGETLYVKESGDSDTKTGWRRVPTA
jgi:parallel beta-helix repeat protein